MNRTVLVVSGTPLDLIRLTAAGSEDPPDLLTAAAQSFAEIRRALCDALTKKYPQISGDVIDIYPERCIVKEYATGSLYEVPYTVADDSAVTLGDWAQVRKVVEYVRVQAAARITAAEGDKASPERGYAWKVQIIEAGTDKQSGITYPLDVLKAAVPLYEGARVFALSQGQHAAPSNPFGKSVRDLGIARTVITTINPIIDTANEYFLPFRHTYNTAKTIKDAAIPIQPLLE